MTVERLINQLKNFNPKAEVRLNDHRGTIALFALATVDDNDLVWIEGKDDIDLGEEIYARFEKASEIQMDELDFFLDLLDMGITLEDIKVILSILVDTFISKISFPMQPGPEIGSISDA